MASRYISGLDDNIGDGIAVAMGVIDNVVDVRERLHGCGSASEAVAHHETSSKVGF